MAKKFYRINQYISADQVRVVDEKGKQVDVMSANQAFKQAQEKGLDLVEVAPKAKPPVCKIIDFKKFKFLEAKKEQEEKKKNKKTETKEIRFKPFIAENDLNFRLKKARKFLKEGHRLKITVRFRGRQITKKGFGYQLMQKVSDALAEESMIENEPRSRGRQLEMTLKPVKRKKNGKKQTKDKKVN